MKSYPVQKLPPIGNQNPSVAEVKPLPPIQIQNFKPTSSNKRKKCFLFSLIILLAVIIVITIASVFVIRILNAKNISKISTTTTKAPGWGSYSLNSKRKCSEGYVGINCEIGN